MIPVFMTVFAFSVIAYITRSRTYWLLAFSALANVYIDHFTHADDENLMVVYSSIEFFTALAVLHYGDIHKIYQTSMLALLLVVHFTMEYALVYDKVAYIESGIYTYIVSTLIILQLMGAGRGLDKLNSLSRSNSHRFKDNNFSIFNH